jgi:hypothetical protein
MHSWSFQNVNIWGVGGPDPPFLWKLSMTVEINQKELYYNYYTSGTFLTFKFQVKPLPPNFRRFTMSLKISVIIIQHWTLQLWLVRVYEKANPQATAIVPRSYRHYVPEDQCNHHTTLNIAVVRVYEKANPQATAIVPRSYRQVSTFLSSI